MEIWSDGGQAGLVKLVVSIQVVKNDAPIESSQLHGVMVTHDSLDRIISVTIQQKINTE